MKIVLFEILTFLWRLERRALSDSFRFGLSMNLRRSYWKSRLARLGADTGIFPR